MIIKIDGQEYKACDVDADGNCFFRSICEHSYFKKMNCNHSFLRNEVSKRMKTIIESNEKVLKVIHKNFHLQDKNVSLPKAHRYLNRISQSTVWCGSFEAMLISYLFPVNIKTVMSVNRIGEYRVTCDSYRDLHMYRLVTDEHRCKREDIHILYHELGCMELPQTSWKSKGNHYLFLKPTVSIVENQDQSKGVQDPYGEVTDTESYQSGLTDTADGSESKIEPCDRERSNTIVVQDSEPQKEACGTIPLPKRRVTLPIAEWYRILKIYESERKNFKSAVSFLKDSASNPLSLKDKSAFFRHLKQHRSEKLKLCGNEKAKRHRKSEYALVEEKVLVYIKSIRDQTSEIVPQTRNQILEYSLSVWDDLSDEEKSSFRRPFTATDAWLSRLQRREGLTFIRKQREKRTQG